MIDFPSSPINGQTYSYQGVSYQYNDPPGIWVIYDSEEIPDPSSIYTAHVGASAPGTPSNGQLWYNTALGILFIYIDDGDSNQWIQL